MMMGIRNGAEANLTGPIIRNNVIRDTTEAGISVASSSMIIEGNDISGQIVKQDMWELIARNTKITYYDNLVGIQGGRISYPFEYRYI